MQLNILLVSPLFERIDIFYFLDFYFSLHMLKISVTRNRRIILDLPRDN